MNLKQTWIDIIDEVSKELPRPQVLTWFKNTALLEKQEGVLKIGLPLPYFLNWHQTHLAKKILKAAQMMDASVKELHYEVNISLNEQHPLAIDILKHFPTGPGRKLPKANLTKSKEGVLSKILNPQYTLDGFITSPENRLAHAACQNVAKYPGQNYNPLFIYGGVGLGKTHLLQATGNEILKNDPTAFVVYTTTEEFANEVIQAMRSKNMEHIRKKYRRVDVLIIDDIQFIANKDKTEEEFFHTFNALYESGKQIIISSDRPPHELKLLSERLTSRFESGMTIDVRMPDYEARLAILMEKCRESQVFINQGVLEFMAMNITHSVRALEGVLNRAIADYLLMNTSPTIQSVAALLKNTPSKEAELAMFGMEANGNQPKEAVNLDSLIDSVVNYFSIRKEEVTGTSRSRDLLVPRQVIMYLANTKLRISLVKIGQALGNRNHTTVMHGVGRIKEQLKNDRQLLRDINAITREVGIL